MNTRFSPSLNGSLHVGHLWMAHVNHELARSTGGRFVLRFDDVAPRIAGDAGDDAERWASEGRALLAAAGIEPDAVTYLSDYMEGGEPQTVGGSNLWLRPPDYEGWDDVPCAPQLVAARALADTREGIDVVVRGEELVPELQLYEHLNHQQGGPRRRLVFLPRMRVRCAGGPVQTISKTVGNLQLRDLYAVSSPSEWVARVRAAGLQRPELPAALDNIAPDPVLSVDAALPGAAAR